MPVLFIPEAHHSGTQRSRARIPLLCLPMNISTRVSKCLGCLEDARQPDGLCR